MIRIVLNLMNKIAKLLILKRNPRRLKDTPKKYPTVNQTPATVYHLPAILNKGEIIP